MSELKKLENDFLRKVKVLMDNKRCAGDTEKPARKTVSNCQIQPPMDILPSNLNQSSFLVTTPIKFSGDNRAYTCTQTYNP